MEGTGCDRRLLLIIQDQTIGGRTRIQKYGFYIYQKYPVVDEYGFYTDWKPNHFGPYSQELADGIDAAVRDGHLIEIRDEKSGTEFKKYRLSVEASKEYKELKREKGFLEDMQKLIKHLQGLSLMTVLKQVYWDYPEFAAQGLIRGREDH
ncbi:MAG: hypothetical protein MPI95_04230 [Nitrosopumilus sp.]|nr:hypothetical protein [Nitrosopumilus sp.]MDA7941571.1 hypothetical protein [Nitrosopumilus sp.]MDA7943576.1 hypothetical protein [Nitrosopumilus sp.]MDA7945037.1 hypothetical protein [Nitrosopumilus sp.]MDA7952823.1 hypothetical protein [Nitrosopumilus sp.]